MHSDGSLRQAYFTISIIILTIVFTLLIVSAPHSQTPEVQIRIDNITELYKISPFIDTEKNLSTGKPVYRWVLIRDELDQPGNLEKVKEVMRRAKNAGYNGIVFSNLWSLNTLESLDSASPEYKNTLTEFKMTADDLGLDIYPLILSVGTANSILAHNPNLVEGLPVRDMLFVVQNGQANLVADPYVSVPNGGFEMIEGDAPRLWDSQKESSATLVDYCVRHSGERSILIVGACNGSIRQTIPVSPFRQYDLSLWIKTAGLAEPSLRGLTINGTDDHRQLTYPNPKIAGNQDWTLYHIVFNSLDNTAITVQLNCREDVWGGRLWVDDMSLNELGLTNVIRRTAYPLEVSGEDGTVYSENVDFMPVIDPQMGVGGVYDAYHAGPAIQLTKNSRIKEGERLRVSFYHVCIPTNGIVAVSLTDPHSYDIFRNQVKQIYNIFSPKGFFINYDEIATGNWETRPLPVTQGQVLAYSFMRICNMIHKSYPECKLFVWNDMFDPNMHAINNYLLVNGTCDGSYYGLSPNVVIVNWNNLGRRNESMSFFEKRGHSQILAGYYDGWGYPIDRWLSDARNMDIDIAGVMYATWEYDYSGLEKFARDAWGQDISPDYY